MIRDCISRQKAIEACERHNGHGHIWAVIMNDIKALPTVDEADYIGCTDCEFEDKEDWEMPCVSCKRIARDYWRKAKA